MHGNFTPLDLAEILRDMLITERSGVLRFQRAGVWKNLGFSQGMIATGTSSLEGENLLSLLVESSRMPAESALEASDLVADPVTLGGYLVKRNLVDPTNLAAGMHELIGQVVDSLFKWESGSYELEEKETSPQPFAPDVLRSVGYIFQGIRAIPDFHAVQGVLLQLEKPLKWKEFQYLPVESLAFGALEGFVISRVDGKTTLKEICSLAPGQEEGTCRFLYGLLVLGMIGLDPPNNGDRFSFRTLAKEVQEDASRDKKELEEIRNFLEKTSKGSPWELLRIKDSDPLVQAKVACDGLRKKFRLERFSPRIRNRMKEELELIGAKILEAFLACQSIQASRARREAAAGKNAGGLNLEEVAQRKELSKTERQALLEGKIRLAEQFFQRAREAFAVSDFHSAVEYGTNAIRNHPDNSEYFAFLATCQQKNPDYRWQKRAEENFLRAIELDPWKVEYYLDAAIFYEEHQMPHKAIRHLEKALELQPNHPRANQEIRRLNKKK